MRIPLTTIGLLQYLAPIMQFAIGVGDQARGHARLALGRLHARLDRGALFTWDYACARAGSHRLPSGHDPEARMQQSEYGLVAATDGWFTVNVRDAAWVKSETFGDACIFEGGPVDFAQIGYTLAVLQPGQPNGMYHREDDQEDFLVLSGECLAIIEGEERPLKAWDFVHCPPGHRAHLRRRGRRAVRDLHGGRPRAPRAAPSTPRDEAALRHGAGVETETPHSKEAYAPFPTWRNGPPETMPF